MNGHMVRAMKRVEIIGRTKEILQKVGFYVSSTSLLSGMSFDIIARRDKTLLVIKILSNIDSLDKEIAEKLGTLAKLLDGSPLVVGYRSTASVLEAGVQYKRYNIAIITLETLYDFFVEGTPPMMEAGKGGYYVSIDGKQLERVRLQKKISLSVLANTTGVSKRTIQQYEKGMRTTIDIALRLEELTGEELIEEQNILKQKYEKAEEFDESSISLEGLSSLEKEIIGFLVEIGCKVLPLRHCKVNAITKGKKDLIITGMNDHPQKLKEKARAISTLSKITEKPSVFFLEKEMKRRNVEGIPLIHKRELKRISDPEQIIEIIIERSE